MKVPTIVVALFLIPLATLADPPEPTPSKTIFDRLSASGFSLTRTFTGPDSTSATPDKSEPAEFGFVDDIGKETEFHANFFLHYTTPFPQELGKVTITPSASVEGKISSLDNTSADAWRFRASAVFLIPFGPSINIPDPTAGSDFSVEAHDDLLWASVGAKYETDRDVVSRKVTGEFIVTPTIPSWNMGRFGPVGPKLRDRTAAVDFRWRPFFEVDFGHSSNLRTNTVETDSTLLRLRPRVRAELRLNFFKELMSMKEVTAYADYEYVVLPLEKAHTTHNYFVAGVNFTLSENLGLGFTYSRGEQAPSFSHENRITGAFTVGF